MILFYILYGIVLIWTMIGLKKSIETMCISSMTKKLDELENSFKTIINFGASENRFENIDSLLKKCGNYEKNLIYKIFVRKQTRSLFNLKYTVLLISIELIRIDESIIEMLSIPESEN